MACCSRGCQPRTILWGGRPREVRNTSELTADAADPSNEMNVVESERLPDSDRVAAAEGTDGAGWAAGHGQGRLQVEDVQNREIQAHPFRCAVEPAVGEARCGPVEIMEKRAFHRIVDGVWVVAAVTEVRKPC